MAIASIFCGILLFLYGKKENYSWLLCLALPFFFLLDINTYEMTRSGRMELFSGMLFLLSFYWLSQGKHILSTISTSFLILTHPVAWAAGLILFLYSWLPNRRKSIFYLLPILVILPSLFWLYTLHFDIEAIKEQILGQGQFHKPDVKEGSLLSNILWNRFWPFWKTQPYMILFHLAAIGLAIFNIFKLHKVKLLSIEIIFLFTVTLMALKFATHHRYNVLLVLLTLLIVIRGIQKYILPRYEKQLKWVIVMLLPLLLFPFLSRNVIGLAEREERNPQAVLEWLNKKLPQEEKTLLTGSDILHYYAMQKKDFTFFELIYPQQIDFAKYSNYYALSSYKPHEDAIVIAKYETKTNALAEQINTIRKTKTYNGLVLYRIPNAKILESITKSYDIIY
jgi:hypothetical protein